MKALANCEQGLSNEQKLQARTNIGAIGGVKVTDSSGTTELVPDANGKVTVDLTNAGKVQSDWDETNPIEPSYIQNKPDLSGFATKTELTEGLAGKQNTLIAGDNIVIDGDTISATVPPGAFIGVYTGSSSTNTPYADYLSAWQDGKPVFVKYTLAGGDIFMQMDQIDEDKAIFTRTVGYVSDGVYGHVSNVLLRVGSSDNSYTFYTTSLGSDSQVQSNWTEADPTSKAFILNKPTLSAVATSGSYNDLSNKPSIPAAQVQSDWNQTDNTQVDYIKNKPAQMETKPLVAGTNISFVSASDRVTINSTATKVSTRSAPYTTEVPLSAMDINDPGADFGAVVKDGGGNTIGFLAPKHYGQADEGKTLTVVNDNGYKLEWRPQVGSSSDLKVLTESQQTVNSGTGAYQLTIVDGNCYDITMNADREVQLVTNSTETVHTRITIRNYDDNTCGGCYLTWRDEGLLLHTIYLMLYNQPDTVEYFFDVYIKKVVVNGTTYAIARVHDYPCAYRTGVTDGYSTDTTNFIGRDY